MLVLAALLLANYIPAFGTQYEPAVASNGESYFAVWTDTRTANGIYGTRLTSDGHPLDPTGIYLGNGGRPQVVSCGRNWLVVFRAAGAPELFATAVDRDGRIVAPPHIVSNNLAVDNAPYVASNGSIAVVAYSRKDAIDVAVLDENATLEAFDVATPAGTNAHGAAVASNGSGFLAAWIDSGGVEAVRLDRNGAPVDAQPMHITSQRLINTAPQMASDGHDYLVANQTFQRNTLLRRIGTDGALGDEVVQPPSELLTWAGGHYALLFAGDSGYALRSLDRDGNSRDPGTLIYPGFDPFPSQFTAASIGSNLMLVFATNGDVMAMNVETHTNTPWPRFVIAFTAAPQEPYSIAAGNGDFAIAWQEQSSDPLRIDSYFARIRGNGVPASITRVKQSEVSTLKPRVAWNGRDYEIAYLERGAVVTGIDGEPLAAAPCATDLDLASNGEVTLLVWTDCATRNLRGIRLRGGVPLDTVPLTMSRHAADRAIGELRPRIAWNGSAFVVTWTDLIATPPRGAPPTAYTEVHAVRVTPGLTLLDPQPVEIAGPAAGANEPEIASSGGESMIVYSRGLSIEARVFANDGTLSAPIVVAQSRLFESSPSITWNHGGYFVAWSEGSLTQTDIFGARVPGARIPLVANAKKPLLAGMLMLYERLATEPLYGGVMHAFLQLLDAPRVRPAGR